MHKLWHVFRYEYGRHVFRWRFLMVLLTPVLMAIVMVLLMTCMVLVNFRNDPVGYVDLSGMLGGSEYQSESLLAQVTFLAYKDDAEARQAMQAGDIQAYYVVPADFHQTHRLDLYFRKKPANLVFGEFEDLLRKKILAGYPALHVSRLISSPLVVPRLVPAPGQGSPQGGAGPGGLTAARMGFAAFGYIVVLVALTNCSGYLANAVTDEKTNRTMEILVTSLAPGQLMIGKLLASISIGFTQLLCWFALPIAVLVPAAMLGSSMIDSVLPEWPSLVGLVLGLAVPTFLLFAALAIGLSSLFADKSQASDMVTIFPMLFYLPILLAPVIAAQPNGIIAHVFSFFPLTAFSTLLIRAVFITPPTWQVALSVALISLSAVGAFWLAGRLFRWGMLRYGQPALWKEFLSLVRRR